MCSSRCYPATPVHALDTTNSWPDEFATAELAAAAWTGTTEAIVALLFGIAA
ncbi:hypothetical protein ABI214_09245 [Prescottella soli]|uniref:Uncharacterized protein n=1 Tax=Prescottella soli TaxID=1543852 RepID=A0ABW9FP94_9NOCA